MNIKQTIRSSHLFVAAILATCLAACAPSPGGRTREAWGVGRAIHSRSVRLGREKRRHQSGGIVPFGGDGPQRGTSRLSRG